jgi:deoxyribonucleoside regulator
VGGHGQAIETLGSRQMEPDAFGSDGEVLMPLRGPSRPPAGEFVIDQMVEIATQFYLHGRTQVEIARAMGLDPSTVSRYLKRARDEGIVRIEIRAPVPEEAGLGLALADRYGIARAVVVPGEEPSLEDVTNAAADHVAGLLRSGIRLGVSWGQTMATMVHRLTPGIVSDLDIAQMSGGTGSTTPGVQGSEIVRYLAQLYPPSRVHYLHAPAIVDLVTIQRAILTDRSVQVALAAAATSELALVGVGTLHEDDTLVRWGHLSAEDRMLLLDRGAVGNINTRFFDERGHPVAELEDRTIAIQWEELKRIPTVVAVASGLAKGRAIRGALRTGCVDVLVTDAPTARLLLQSASSAS